MMDAQQDGASNNTEVSGAAPPASHLATKQQV
jgi:hypothetical protein